MLGFVLMRRSMPALRWPAPALLAWAASWFVFIGLRALGVPLLLAVGLAALSGTVLTIQATTRWRRIFIAAGFPLSLAATGLVGPLPGWVWLLALAVLLLAYPVKAWRDAPLFPTPTDALAGLARAAPLAAGAKVLDAGCGLGAGLIELRREYPNAALSGIEWSLPLRLLCGWRCRDAEVRRADIWQASWRDYDLVYLFQRPESMGRALAKATAEMPHGSWLASLEFEAVGRHAEQVLRGPDGRPVWLYRIA